MAHTHTPREAGNAAVDTASMSGLLKRLGAETADLVRAELALAKLEFRELARQTAVDGAKVGAAAALAAIGAIVLAAAAVLALGDVLGGRYALAALAVGVVLLAVGGLLARSGLRSMAAGRESGRPLASLRKDTQWAAGELRELRQQLKSGSSSGRQPALKKP